MHENFCGDLQVSMVLTTCPLTYHDRRADATLRPSQRVEERSDKQVELHGGVDARAYVRVLILKLYSTCIFAYLLIKKKSRVFPIKAHPITKICDDLFQPTTSCAWIPSLPGQPPHCQKERLSYTYFVVR